MNAPFSRFADLGVVHFMLCKGMLDERGAFLDSFRRLAAHERLDAIEVASIPESRTRLEVREILRDARMRVGFAAQPTILSRKLNLNSLEREERLRALDTLEEAAREAAELGAESFTVLSGPDPGLAKRDDARRHLVEALIELDGRISKHGDFCLVLEQFDRAPFAKNALIGPSNEALEVARELRSHIPGFGLLVDLSHLPLLAETPRGALHTLNDFIAHIHIGNCVMKDETHPMYGDNHPPIGDEAGENGIPELAAFLQELLNIGYLRENGSNIVAFEVAPNGAMSAEKLLADSLESLDAAWQDVSPR